MNKDSNATFHPISQAQAAIATVIKQVLPPR
jgi:hypothetical protein